MITEMDCGTEGMLMTPIIGGDVIEAGDRILGGWLHKMLKSLVKKRFS